MGLPVDETFVSSILDADELKASLEATAFIW